MYVSRLSGMDNDLFTYKVEVANIPCNFVMDDDLEDETDGDMGYDPSDVAFIEWIFEDEDEIADVYGPITKDIMGLRPMMGLQNDGSTNGIRMYHGLMRNHGLTLEFGQSQNQSNILASLSTIKLGVRNSQPLDDCELKEEALRNKDIMDGVINDDESCCELKRKWNIYTNYDDAYEINHEDNGNKELCEIHEPPVCNIRKYMIIKYSFNDDEEYVAVKEYEYDDLIMTRRDACQAYQEIFRIIDEGWMVTRAT
ncbi:hypothetical protein Tco_0620025 [Tanacetum coccineum]